MKVHLSTCWQRGQTWIGWRSSVTGSGASDSNLLSPKLWLAKGDLAQARTHAESFLKTALATAEHTWQALAWEVNARLAMAELDLTSAQDGIAKGCLLWKALRFRWPPWRVHATAAELYRRMKSRELAERQLALSRKTIMKLANSLPAEEPLRHIFLSAPKIRKFSEKVKLQSRVPKKLDGRKCCFFAKTHSGKSDENL